MSLQFKIYSGVYYSLNALQAAEMVFESESINDCISVSNGSNIYHFSIEDNLIDLFDSDINSHNNYGSIEFDYNYLISLEILRDLINIVYNQTTTDRDQPGDYVILTDNCCIDYTVDDDYYVCINRLLR